MLYFNDQCIQSILEGQLYAVFSTNRKLLQYVLLYACYLLPELKESGRIGSDWNVGVYGDN